MKWTSIKCELPQLNKKVLVYCGDDNFFISQLTDMNDFYKQFPKITSPPKKDLYKKGIRFHSVGLSCQSLVTHWIDIPEFVIDKGI